MTLTNQIDLLESFWSSVDNTTNLEILFTQFGFCVTLASITPELDVFILTSKHSSMTSHMLPLQFRSKKVTT